MSRDHDDLGAQRVLLARLQQSKAVHPGQTEIGNDDLKGPFLDHLEPLMPGRGGVNIVVNRLKGVHHGETHQRLVIDDQN